ncbi:MAG: rhomboid family intramembrane serine protease [Acidimicrobiales bacterium]
MALPLRDDVPTRRFPLVTVTLIAVNVVVFLFLQPSAYQNPPSSNQITSHDVERSREAAVYAFQWGAVPCEVASGSPRADRPKGCPSSTPGYPLPETKSVYLALLTSMFLHGSTSHLGGNMLFLWVFGNNVEDRLGRLGFLAFYLIGGVVAALGFVFTNVHGGSPLLGASGAIAAAMGAYLVFYPRGRILTVILAGTYQLVYIPAAVVLALFFVTQFFTPDNGVAWEAHAIGMGAGFVAALALSRLGPIRRRALNHADDVTVRGGQAF